MEDYIDLYVRTWGIKKAENRQDNEPEDGRTGRDTGMRGVERKKRWRMGVQGRRDGGAIEREKEER